MTVEKVYPLSNLLILKHYQDPQNLITGDDTVCSDYETYNYSVPMITKATSYTWTVPSGISITSGTGTNSIIITVSPKAISDTITVEGKNTCGSGTASVKNIIVKVCTGIFVNKKETGISVFPNPAGGELTIAITDGENKMDVRIIDMRGQAVFRESLNNIPNNFRQMIDVSAFSRDVYFVEITSSRIFMIRKIILQ